MFYKLPYYQISVVFTFSPRLFSALCPNSILQRHATCCDTYFKSVPPSSRRQPRGTNCAEFSQTDNSEVLPSVGLWTILHRHLNMWTLLCYFLLKSYILLKFETLNFVFVINKIQFPLQSMYLRDATHNYSKIIIYLIIMIYYYFSLVCHIIFCEGNTHGQLHTSIPGALEKHCLAQGHISSSSWLIAVAPGNRTTRVKSASTGRNVH